MACLLRVSGYPNRNLFFFPCVNDYVSQHLPGPVHLFLLSSLAFDGIAIISHTIDGRPVSPFILHLPDARLGMAPLLTVLLNHELNCFVANTSVLQIGDLLSRQTLALLRQGCNEQENQNGCRYRAVYVLGPQILLDKRPN